MSIVIRRRTFMLDSMEQTLITTELQLQMIDCNLK